MTFGTMAVRVAIGVLLLGGLVGRPGFAEQRAPIHVALGRATGAPLEGAGEAAELARSSELTALHDKVDRCLAQYYAKPESAASRTPWEVMHSMIAFGVDTQLVVGGRSVNAIGWMCWNGACRGQRLLSVRGGRPAPQYGVGLEGHGGQFLSMLAQCRVKSDYEIRVDGRRFTVADLVEYEKRTCRPKSELSFKLIGLSHYLDSEETWQSDTGETWSVARLIREELPQPIVGVTCGGTHRLMGLAYAVRKREKRGEPIDGPWKLAQEYVGQWCDYALKLQNADGSFSTNWLAGRANSGDAGRRLQTSGHILEWLVFALPEERLEDPRVEKAVDYLAGLMLNGRPNSWAPGPAGHALRALTLYDERLFDAQPGQRFATTAGGGAENQSND